MKHLILVALTGLLLALPGKAQDPSAPPAEMKSVAFLVGHWEGDLVLNVADGVNVKMKASMDCSKTLNGRFIQQNHTYTADGSPAMTGMLMLTYDAEGKKWVSWWFDSMAPAAMEMSGQMGKDGTAVLLSKPVKSASSPESVTRSTWTHVSDTNIKMKLEMQEAGKWTTFLEADFKKK